MKKYILILPLLILMSNCRAVELKNGSQVPEERVVAVMDSLEHLKSTVGLGGVRDLIFNCWQKVMPEGGKLDVFNPPCTSMQCTIEYIDIVGYHWPFIAGKNSEQKKEDLIKYVHRLGLCDDLGIIDVDTANILLCAWYDNLSNLDRFELRDPRKQDTSILK